MFDIGLPEMIVIGVVMLLVLGPDKLPDTFRTIGRVVRQLREASSQITSEFQRAMDEGMREETPSYTPYTPSTSSYDYSPSTSGSPSDDSSSSWQTESPLTAAAAVAPSATAAEESEATARVDGEQTERPWRDSRLLIVVADPMRPAEVVDVLESWGATFSVVFDIGAAEQALSNGQNYIVLLDAQFPSEAIARLAGALRGAVGDGEAPVVWLGEPPLDSPLTGRARSVALPVDAETLRTALAEVATTVTAADAGDSAVEPDGTGVVEGPSDLAEAAPADAAGPDTPPLAASGVGTEPALEAQPAPATEPTSRALTAAGSDGSEDGDGVVRPGGPGDGASRDGETNLEVKLPAELHQLLEGMDEPPSARMKELAVIGLYREGRVTLPYGAKLLGMTPDEFAALLEKKGVSGVGS